MAADPVALQRIKRTGLGALTPRQGLEALEALLMAQPSHGHLVQAAAVSVEWSIVLKVRSCLPLLNCSNLPPAPAEIKHHLMGRVKPAAAHAKTILPFVLRSERQDGSGFSPIETGSGAIFVKLHHVSTSHPSIMPACMVWDSKPVPIMLLKLKVINK